MFVNEKYSVKQTYIAFQVETLVVENLKFLCFVTVMVKSLAMVRGGIEMFHQEGIKCCVPVKQEKHVPSRETLVI